MEEQARIQEAKNEEGVDLNWAFNIARAYIGDKAPSSLKLLEELVKRATPMKPILDYFGGYKCPNCGEFKLECSFDNYGVCDTRLDYCPDCGQALDWSDK